MQPNCTHPQRVRLKALGGCAVRRRQARNGAQIATNVRVRAWARVTAEEHRAEHLSYLRLRLIASVRGSESAAHLALLSGHAKANGGAGQGIESVTDDQVTLRHHGGARTKGTFHRPIAFLRSNERSQVSSNREIPARTGTA